MVVVRWISVVFVALALMVLGADLMFWLETATFEPHTLMGIWRIINAGSAAAAQSSINSLPDAASGALDSVLDAWAFVVLGIPGIVLAIIGARR